MKLLTRELVESLDLVVASSLHPAERQDIETIKLVDSNTHKKVIEEWKGERLREVQIFGAIVGDYNRIFPYLSEGNPIKDDRFMYGNMGVQRSANSLSCLYDGAMENSITLDDHTMYYGGHEWGKVTVFEKPLPFDPAKEFMLVRSPNGSVSLNDILYQTSLGEGITLGNWLIINENGTREAREYDITGENSEQRELTERYFLGNYEKEVMIEEEADRISLKIHFAPELPAWEKLPSGGYKSTGRDWGKAKRFITENAAQLKNFDPLTFDPENNLFKEQTKEERKDLQSQERHNFKDYSLIYASPAELLQGRSWAYNNAVTGRNSIPRITRYNNHHLVG